MMKLQKLYSTIKPYTVISVLVFAISSVSAHATEKNQDNHSQIMSHQKAEGHQHSQKKMQKQLRRLAKRLALSQEQRKTVKALFKAEKAENQEDKVAMLGFKAQVKLLLQASDFDENKFDAIYMEFQPSLQKSAMKRAKIRHAIMQVLTPEQQQEFLNMRKHR